MNDARISQTFVFSPFQGLGRARRTTLSEYNRSPYGGGVSNYELSEQAPEEFYGDCGHKLEPMLNKQILKNRAGKFPEALLCALCSNEVDHQYFTCVQCKIDYCRRCAQNAGYNESQMAENPLLLPTPMTQVV